MSHPLLCLRIRPCVAIGSVWLSARCLCAASRPEASACAKKGASVSCWSCGACVNEYHLFCGKCEYIQPPGRDANLFKLLDVPQQFDLRPSDLEANFKRLQRVVHPDLFGTKTKREQEISADASSQLNTAYRVLRSPSTRAQYLLQLHGIDAIGEASGATYTDGELLMEIMEARELLSNPNVSRAEVEALHRGAVAHIARAMTLLTDAFGRNLLDAAAKLTVTLQYWTKLVNEAEDWFERRGETAPPAVVASPPRVANCGVKLK